MKIILTDKKEYCPQDLPEGYCLEVVNTTSIQRHSGDNNVEIVWCSRGLAKTLENIELPACKLVQLFSVGLDAIDVDQFKKRGVPLCNATGVYDNVLAEYVVYSMLLYAKRYHRSLRNRWFRPLRNYHYMTELAGKTVGIMGVGRIGTAVANHLSSFGMDITGYAQHTTEKQPFSKIYHRDGLNEFLRGCDFLVNILPHDGSTIGMIDREFLEHVKSNVVFINIGRDSIFNGDDFYHFMKTHKEATAILDMFELIPNPITNKYRRLKNVLVTPRISAISKESTEGLKKLLKSNTMAIINNTALTNRIV